MENHTTIWPGWETVKLIGRGSFGAVYEIQRNVFDNVEKAAMKIISIPQNASDIDEMYGEGYDEESITSTFQSHLKSIVSEYSLMKKMSGCTNVVNCDDIRYIQHDDGIGWDIFIKMELLTPLMKELPTDIPEETAIRVGKDICAALELCKEHGIVHRDIKPQNIFVSSRGDYKLGDFGIAKTVEKTMGGTKIGTYKYMAPEVYNNQPYGSGADIYSLGLVLYWLLNEKRMPFLPLPPAKQSVGMEEEARSRRFRGEVLPEPAHGSEALKRIVLKACAYDPKARYQSATEMLAALNGLSQQPVPMPMPTPEPTPEPDPIAEPEPELPTQEPVVITQKIIHDIQREKQQDIRESSKEKNDKKAHPLLWVATGVVATILLLLLLTMCGDKNNYAGGDANISGTVGGGETVRPTETLPLATSKPVQVKEWSDWVDQLPEYVSAENYEIEEKTLYSSRTLETTSSTETSTMPGWELYDTVAANGGFGPWSAWSATKVTASATREVQTQTRYRYRIKETTTSASSTKNGWTMYDITYSWSDYGPWSDWSTNAVYNSDSRKIETKTQYRYRSISYSTEYTDWGAWSSWQDDYVSATDLREVETRTAYHYYYFICSNCGKHLPGKNLCYGWDGGCGKTNTGGSYTTLRLDTPYSSTTDYNGVGMRYIIYNGEKVFAYTNSSSQHYKAPITQYRYRTRTAREVAHYGNWSAWQDTAYSNSSTREVQTRTVYRYCDRSEVVTYHYYRWGTWSDWSTDSVTENNNRQVENTTYYRYREQVKTKTYYFRRWTDWSAYSESPVTATEEREIQTKTQYRYKKREN